MTSHTNPDDSAHPITRLFTDTVLCEYGYDYQNIDPESESSDRAIDQILNDICDVVPSKRIRLIADWTWVDITFPHDAAHFLADQGLQPCIVFANNLLLDSSQQLVPGDWVRTTFLVKFNADLHTFETANSAYVLIGPGRRTTISTEVLKLIYALAQ